MDTLTLESIQFFRVVVTEISKGLRGVGTV
jgi:hypothetical protein